MHTIIYEQIVQERNRIEEQIKSLQQQLQSCPEGNLVFTHSGKYNKFYQSIGSQQIYIPKKKLYLAEKLAYKRYLSLKLKNLLHEKTALDFYLRHHNSNAAQAEENYCNTPEFQQLLAPYFKPLSKELHEWAEMPYTKNPLYPEKLTHKTYSGQLVRSKSEAMIDMFLYKNKIPFRYECELKLGDFCIYPDFTIRHPKSGEIFYWEHFGMMDDANYSRNAFSKLQQYSSNGIFPTIQLITTYESKDYPLDMKTVESLVNQYFLDE